VRSSDVKKPFGTSVKVWRGRLGISQEELAERSGLHRTYISDVERGARNVSLKSIEKLAAALEVSVSTLLAYAREAGPDAAAGLFAAEDLVEILYADRAEQAGLTLQALKKFNIVNTIHLVHDGVAALHYLFGADEPGVRMRPRPRLVLLDLDLPKLDGLELLRRIKADPRTSSIPVVLIGSSLHENIAASQRLGAAAYIARPVSFTNLSEAAAQSNLRWGLLRVPQRSGELQTEKKGK
jgi:CheY-like chemotaxis protein